jgi:hypothetical protein
MPATATGSGTPAEGTRTSVGAVHLAQVARQARASRGYLAVVPLALAIRFHNVDGHRVVGRGAVLCQ